MGSFRIAAGILLMSSGFLFYGAESPDSITRESPLKSMRKQIFLTFQRN